MPRNNGKKKDSEKNPMNSDKAILKELALMRRLMVFLIAKLGSDSPEISAALQIPQRTLRGWVSFSSIDKSNGRADNKEDREMMQVSKKINTAKKANRAKKRVSKKINAELNTGTESIDDKATELTEGKVTESTEREVKEEIENKTTEPTEENS